MTPPPPGFQVGFFKIGLGLPACQPGGARYDEYKAVSDHWALVGECDSALPAPDTRLAPARRQRSHKTVPGLKTRGGGPFKWFKSDPPGTDSAGAALMLGNWVHPPVAEGRGRTQGVPAPEFSVSLRSR